MVVIAVVVTVRRPAVVVVGRLEPRRRPGRWTAGRPTGPVLEGFGRLPPGQLASRGYYSRATGVWGGPGGLGGRGEMDRPVANWSLLGRPTDLDGFLFTFSIWTGPTQFGRWGNGLFLFFSSGIGPVLQSILTPYIRRRSVPLLSLHPTGRSAPVNPYA